MAEARNWDRIKEYWQVKGWDSQDLADFFNIPKKTIQNKITGWKKVSTRDEKPNNPIPTPQTTQPTINLNEVVATLTDENVDKKIRFKSRELAFSVLAQIQNQMSTRNFTVNESESVSRIVLNFEKALLESQKVNTQINIQNNSDTPSLKVEYV